MILTGLFFSVFLVGFGLGMYLSASSIESKYIK